MKFEFEQGRITIQADADAWGPFTFDFEGGIPAGRTIASAVVKTYLGRVKPEDSDILSTFTETTAELLDSNEMSSDYIVAVYLNRPTTAAYINVKHSIVITITLDAASGGGAHSAFYYMVDVI